MALTAKQQAFCIEYATCGIATLAAERAGYKSPRSQGSRLLTNADVVAHIKRVQDELSTAKILTAKQRQVILSDIANSVGYRNNADRIKAIDTLNKMTGEYLTKVEATVNTNGKINELIAAVRG